jgi:ribonuclease HI
MSRCLWLRRNDLIQGSHFTHPKMPAAQTIQAITEFSLAHDHDEPHMPAHIPQTMFHWMAPGLGWTKVNFGAALVKKQGRMGLGVVLWDSRGTMLAARCVARDGCLAPAAAEVMALLLAIRSCHELNLSRVHFEGDAKSVIYAMNSEEVDCGWMGHIIANIKLELRTFQQWQLTFTRREGNQVAHLLTKYAVDCNQDFYWRNMPPECICDALLLEQSALVA